MVVPCFNEAGRLDVEAFVDARRRFPHLRFLFVDDGSTDATGAVLASMTARDPEGLSSLTLAANQGKGEAVRRGLERAFALGADAVGYLDADLSTPIDELDALIDVLNDPEVLLVLGSRVALLGRHITRSVGRHYSGRVFATVASLVLGLRVYDTQCGAKLLRNVEPIRELFDRPFTTRWAFDVEMLARLRQLERAGRIAPVERVVVEVPLRRWTDVAGSKVSLMAGVVAGLQLLRLWWLYRRPPAGR